MASRQLRGHDELRAAPHIRVPPGPRFSGSPRPPRPPKPPSVPPGYYRPGPLRWPFLLSLMVVLATTLGVLVALLQTMPDSDHSAVVDGRPLARSLPILGDPAIYHDLALRRIPRLSRQTNDTHNQPLEETQNVFSTTVSTATSTSSRFRISKTFPPLPDMSEDLVYGPTDILSSSETVPTTLDPSRFANATRTGDINRSPTVYPTDGLPVKITEVVTTNATPSTAVAVQPSTNPFHIASVNPDPGPIITGGTTTSFVVTDTVTPPPQTTTDSAGRTTVVSHAPIPTTKTISGVVGGQLDSTPLPGDGIVVQTTTIIAVAGASSVTRTTVTSLSGRLSTQTLVSLVGGSSVTQVVVFPTRVGITTRTLVSVVGGTVVTITPSPTTSVRNLGGGMFTTIISTPAPYITTTGGRTTTMLITNVPGRIITTDIATLVNGTPTVIRTVLTITPTPTSAPKPGGSGESSPNTRVRVIPGFTPAQFFAVTYLPTILAACLAIPFNMISINAKLMQPFHALATRPGGGSASDTLTLNFRGYWGMPSSLIQALRRGEPVPLLADLGSLLSSMLAPLAAEAIGFKVHGICTHLDIAGCGITPGISPAPAQALIALVAASVGLVLLLALILRRWETGVHADPWNLAAVASLSMHPSLRELFNSEQLPDEKLNEKLKGKRFRLAIFDSEDAWGEPCHEYGIVPSQGTHTPLLCTGTTTTTTVSSTNNRRHMPFLALTYPSRILFILALLGLIALLSYYHQPLPDTPFELFMDSQAFGVKFLFALLGTAIAAFWRAFLEGVAAAAPFARMARQPCLAGQSILHSPATTANSIAAAVRQRDALLLASAVVAGVAELLLPALLANIPYALTNTYDGHVGATAASLAVLGGMVLLLAWSLVGMRWPHLPVDPRTLAGAIYYVSRSERLRDSLRGQRLALRDEASGREFVEGLHRKYVYGPMGEGERMGVEVEVVDEEEEYRDEMVERWL